MEEQQQGRSCIVPTDLNGLKNAAKPDEMKFIHRVAIGCRIAILDRSGFVSVRKMEHGSFSAIRFDSVQIG
jgi:hypothetical protein